MTFLAKKVADETLSFEAGKIKLNVSPNNLIKSAIIEKSRLKFIFNNFKRL